MYPAEAPSAQDENGTSFLANTKVADLQEPKETPTHVFSSK